MKAKSRKKEDAKFGNELKAVLRGTGEMIPATPKQVKAFEKKNAQPIILPDLLSNPLAILERGHISPELHENTDSNTTTPKMAARNLKKLSPETLRKMEEDRHKFLEELNKKSKQ